MYIMQDSYRKKSHISPSILPRWLVLLVKTLQYVIEGPQGMWKSVPGLYSRVSFELKIFQSLAALEVWLVMHKCNT